MRVPHLPILQKLATLMSQETSRQVTPLRETHLDPKDIVDIVDPSPEGAKAMDKKYDPKDQNKREQPEEKAHPPETEGASEGEHIDIQI